MSGVRRPVKRHWSRDLTPRGWWVLGLSGMALGGLIGFLTAGWNWYG